MKCYKFPQVKLRLSEDEYEIVDLLHDKITKADVYTVWFIRQLNGKRNPYRIDRTKSKADVDLLLDKLETKEIIRDRRFLSKNILQTLITVWKPRITPNLRLVSFFINFLMLVSFLPLILFSAAYYILFVNDISFDYIISGSKYLEEVEKIFAKVKVLREQLETLEVTSSQSDESSSEMNRISEILKNSEFTLNEYDDLIVRRTIECIRVMSNKTIAIIFKGGYEMTETLED